MVGLLVDLKGNIITKTQVSRPRAQVNEVAESLLEIVREIFRRSKEYVHDIKGVGIGIAGLINKQDGSIHWPQKMNHYYTYASVDLPLRQLIEKEFSLPALIENDASSACLGEYLLNLDSSVRNAVYMFSGVGCGIVINGELYTGSSGYAGETSIYNFKEQDDFSCAASRGCFLKRTEMDLGMVEELKGMLERDKQAAERFYKLTGSKSGNIELRTIFNAMRANEPLALKCLDLAAHRLGIRIASIVNLLNPEVVVVGGGLEEAGDRFLNSVTETVKSWAFREATQDLKIIYSQLRENAVALGAASLVIRKVFARML
jgi:glucokinase